VPNPAYRRRVNTLLNNEDYGPKLARLGAHDQRTVLELVYQNRGREARSEIVRLDRERREFERLAKKYPEIRQIRRRGWYKNGRSERIRYTFMTPGEALRYAEDLVDDHGVPDYLPTIDQNFRGGWTVAVDSES
jgi:hypothetical protein